MADTPRGVALSVRAYKVLIKAYPSSFRREYGGEMVLVFGEQMTNVFQKKGAAGLVAAWLRVLGDLARTVPEEHLHEMQRSLGMKTAAYAVLSCILAAITYGFIYLFLGITIVLPLLATGLVRTGQVAMLPSLYLSAFLTGLILTRVQPFFMPFVTVPLAITVTGGLWGFLVFQESGQTGYHPPWVAAVAVGASVVLTSLVGCFVATKASSRLARLSIRWFQLAGTLAILVCTSCVAGVLSITLSLNKMDADMQRVLAFCLFAMLVIAAVTIANLVSLFVRSYRNSEKPELAQAKPSEGPTALP
jgi:hypothetical protein